MDDFEKARDDASTKDEYDYPSFYEGARWAREWLDQRLKTIGVEVAEKELEVIVGNATEKLRTENQRLKKIIAKELSENDELGCEYTYVNILKDENQRLREALEKAKTYICCEHGHNCMRHEVCATSHGAQCMDIQQALETEGEPSNE